MKKTLVSLAAVAAMTTGAMAADKGIDIKTTGQAVIYYQTTENNGDDFNPYTPKSQLFDKDSAVANVGVQLNLDADLKNNFTFGSQFTYLGTAGLEKNLVSGVVQQADPTPTQGGSTTSEIALTKIFVAKKIGNSTIKIGRQELPKSLSPLAFSESWSVFKNTFDAILAVNTDIPDTTIVGAYVAGGTGMGDLGTATDMGVVTDDAGTADMDGTAYLLTVQNKSIPMTAITASYYDMAKIGANVSGNAGITVGATALWADVTIAGKDMPLGLKIGGQYGSIMPDASLGGVPTFSDTTAYGVKVGLAPSDAFSICLAYTSVDGDDNKVNVAVKNVGTGIKTPLYTQMIGNQDAIALDGNTIMLKMAFGMGDSGTIIAQGAMTDAGKSNLNTYTDATGIAQGNDFTEWELIYKVKAGGINWLAAYIDRSLANKDAGVTGLGQADHNSIARVVARYNF